MLDSHFATLHILQTWTAENRFWTRCTLRELNYVLRLGHQGRRCPISLGTPRDMVVVHTEGVDRLQVEFCCCLVRDSGRERESEVEQLIRAGFWPGSWHIPQTVYTLEVLDKFSILSHQAHTNAKDFFDSLKRLSDNIATHEVDVCETVIIWLWFADAPTGSLSRVPDGFTRIRVHARHQAFWRSADPWPSNWNSRTLVPCVSAETQHGS